MRSSSGSGKMLGIPFPNFSNRSASSTDVRIKKDGFDSLDVARAPEGFTGGAKLNKNASKSADKYLPKCENANGYDLLQRPASSHERPSSS
uniref:Microtubule-associated protein Jupiter n=1 Tax=Steinernema glaseri TaxID=37863 RepID=A0A1I7ZYN5_9BILA